MQNIIRRLQHLEVLKNLQDRDLKEISSHVEIICLKNREVLFEKNLPIKYIYMILSGSVKIQESLDESNEKIFNFLGRGEFLGTAMAGLTNPKYPTSSVCNEDCTFLKIPLPLFNRRLMHIPEVQIEVNRQIAERFLEFQNDICRSHFLVPHRLANFLLRLLDKQVQTSNKICIPLTRVDISRRIGAQSETVIRVISQWTKLNWVKTDDRHIEILDRKALGEINRERPSKKSQIRTYTDSKYD